MSSTRFVSALAAVGLAVAAAACTAKQPPHTAMPEPSPIAESAPAATPAPPPDPRPLYERMERYHADYLTGVELLAAGIELEGEARIAGASNGLREVLDECRRTAGCDAQLISNSLFDLLDEQNIHLKQQAARVFELETNLEQDVEREPGTTPFIATVPEIGHTVSLLRGTDLRDLIALNGPVKAALDDWLTWMRPMLIEAYENYQFLRPKVAPIYEEAGLPEALLFAMMATETGGKVHAYSRAGAAGPLQFMRSTGRRYGLDQVDGFDMRLDPAASTRANVAYLNDQFAAFNNSLEKALAAYNGGESRMERLQRRHGEASLWDTELYYSLPRETREYVPRVLAAAWLFLHPEEFQLEFQTPATETTRLVLQAEISISELAICLGQQENYRGWFRTLRNLNPRLGPGDRVEAGGSIEVPTAVLPVYEARCLDGELLARARELHEAAYLDEPELVPYFVRRGDTLSKIASRHNCISLRELAALNEIRPPRYVIHVGQRLRIPNCS